MKSNKTAILGMLAAMVMSLGAMNGEKTKHSSQNDSNLAQLGLCCIDWQQQTENAYIKTLLKGAVNLAGSNATICYGVAIGAAATGIGLPAALVAAAEGTLYAY